MKTFFIVSFLTVEYLVVGGKQIDFIFIFLSDTNRRAGANVSSDLVRLV